MSNWTYDLSDQDLETGSNMWEDMLTKTTGGVIDAGTDLLRKTVGLDPGSPAVPGQPQTTVEQPEYPVQQQQLPGTQTSTGGGGITNFVKSIPPLAWGGAGAAISFLLWKKPLTSLLIGGGMWLLTDKVIK